MKQQTFQRMMVIFGSVIFVMLLMVGGLLLFSGDRQKESELEGKVCMSMNQYMELKNSVGVSPPNDEEQKGTRMGVSPPNDEEQKGTRMGVSPPNDEEQKVATSHPQPQLHVYPHLHPHQHPQVPPVPDRDIRVIDDPLYPPLNRTDRHTFDHMVAPLATSHHRSDDRFRLIGYLKSTHHQRDVGGGTWKLYGRMKDRHMGEFYLMPANNVDDIKVPLTDDIVVGQRLRDVDTVPSEMRFKSPLLNDGPYVFVELPKAGLPSVYV
jgi:hypothetical protein